MKAVIVFLGLFVTLTLLILAVLGNQWLLAMTAASLLFVVVLNIHFRIKWGFWP